MPLSIISRAEYAEEEQSTVISGIDYENANGELNSDEMINLLLHKLEIHPELRQVRKLYLQGEPPEDDDIENEQQNIDDIVKAIAVLLERKSHPLKEINLSDRNVTDAAIIPLANAIKKSTSLVCLALSSTQMQANGFLNIIMAVYFSTSFQHLTLQNYGITLPASPLLIPDVDNNSLASLSFNNTLFFQQNDIDIITLFARAKNLAFLHLNLCQLTAESMRVVSQFLMQHKTLNVLKCQHNIIGNGGAQHITNALSDDKIYLCCLDLSSAGIERAGIESIFHALQSNHHLTHLTLNDNPVLYNKALREQICRYLENNYTLIALNLGENFRDIDVKIQRNRLALLKLRQHCENKDYNAVKESLKKGVSPCCILNTGNNLLGRALATDMKLAELLLGSPYYNTLVIMLNGEGKSVLSTEREKLRVLELEIKTITHMKYSPSGRRTPSTEPKIEAYYKQLHIVHMLENREHYHLKFAREYGFTKRPAEREGHESPEPKKARVDFPPFADTLGMGGPGSSGR